MALPTFLHRWWCQLRLKYCPECGFSRFSLSLQQITINYAAQSRGYYGFRQIGITSCVMKCLHNKRAKACAGARRGLTVWPKLAVFAGGVMSSIHGHEVLQMMLASGESPDGRLAGGRHSPPLWRRGAVLHLFSRESKRRTVGGVFREKKANLLPERKVLLPQKIRSADIKRAATRTVAARGINSARRG